MSDYPENCTVIRSTDIKPKPNAQADESLIKYWCNACGELHHHGQEDISEEDLPKPLRRVYNELWEEGAAGCCTYLVEMKDGYGIALIGEYDENYAEECGLSMEELFTELLKDMETLAANETLWCAHFYAQDYAGFDDCHELAIVLPANLPVAEWGRIKATVMQIMYTHPNVCRVRNLIRERVRKYHEECGDYDIEVGEVEFRSPSFAEIPVKYKWRLHSWDKQVDMREILIQVGDGYWNMIYSFHPTRFKII